VRRKRPKRPALRADTTVMDAGGREVYLRGMSSCCLGSLKEAAMLEAGDRRRLALECGVCGREWRVTSSLDERILSRFATHGGPRAGGGYPAA
jgi:hypothetical protein